MRKNKWTYGKHGLLGFGFFFVLKGACTVTNPSSTWAQTCWWAEEKDGIYLHRFFVCLFVLFSLFTWVPKGSTKSDNQRKTSVRPWVDFLFLLLHNKWAKTKQRQQNNYGSRDKNKNIINWTHLTHHSRNSSVIVHQMPAAASPESFWFLILHRKSP